MGDCGLSERSVNGGDVTFCDLMGAIYVSVRNRRNVRFRFWGLGVKPCGLAFMTIFHQSIRQHVCREVKIYHEQVVG